MIQLDTQESVQDINLPENVTMTLEDFLENDVEGYEYIKGELVPMPAASFRHGAISVRIIRHLDQYVYKNKLGQLFTAETLFKVGERVLKPDVAFVASERLDVDEDKGLPIPPDLAIEVVSPSDVLSHVVGKVQAYLDAGTRCIWVVEPTLETVTVYKSETDIKTLTRDDTLTGDDIVPGFSCQVEKLFE